jgi:hypothetical protein
MAVCPLLRMFRLVRNAHLAIHIGDPLAELRVPVGRHVLDRS